MKEREIRKSVSADALLVNDSKEDGEEEVDLSGEGQVTEVETLTDMPTQRGKSFFITDRQVNVHGLAVIPIFLLCCDLCNNFCSCRRQ